jgi:tRNA-specific 2-thiouridylase
MGKRVVLAMSGGVDSSVAALLLKEQGHEVIGLFMRTGAFAEDAERRAKTCCSVTDALDARRVADRLDIPFYVLDFADEFARIMDDFADEYAAGRTPNPCVLCNIWLKFGKLWAYGKQAGADFVATGHYARIGVAPDGTTRVARAVDRHKDQSYVLFGLKAALLPHVLFPVGGYSKEEIRAIARDRGLPVHDKPDSQEICFVPGDDYLGFVRARRPELETAGPLVDEDGTELGRHGGIEGFTIGQRRGLGVALGAPRYVVQIEPASRTVTLGRRESLLREGLDAARFNWQGPVPEGPSRCQAQVRARHSAVGATVEPRAGGRARVIFDEPVAAVTPGQVVTVYQDDLVLGGGWIERACDASGAPAIA